MDDRRAAMRRAAELGLEFLDGLDERHVGPRTDATSLGQLIGGPLPEHGSDPITVVEELATAVDPGLVAIGGAALLRVRHRRRAAGVGGRRLAHHRMGPERGAACPLPRRGGHGAGRR